MPFGIDIQEDEIRSWGHGILETLLCDHTTLLAKLIAIIVVLNYDMQQ